MNVDEQRYGTLPLDLDTDADNLTDYEEVNTTLTNPLVPDSDSSVTAPDEAGDGVIDGSEDFDGDGLSNALEFDVGTDPFDPDSDDDGLVDGFEFTYETLDPLSNDTDGDGTGDALEDPDAEGLVNIDEQAAGTSPTDADTDDDTLTDFFEVERSLTSPVGVDSDSAGTNASEAGDGVRDTAEDLENDLLSNAREQALGTDPLHSDTDRDGLTDAYEVDTTGTNPLSNDSDSSVTSANESANEIPDGLEDFDSDQVRAHYEEVFGTDPFDNDTDSDSVGDGFEVRFSVLDPLSADSDGDGVLDAREDHEGDGLDTAAEEAAGTDSTTNDTDFDTLTDSAELNEYETDPRSPDTDDDGLRDDEELDLGTDPLSADSDGDGVADGEETFTTSTMNETVGASVSITGEGNVADSVTVRNSTDAILTSDAVESVAASKPLEFGTQREFERAMLTLSYDESDVSDESELAVFRWDPDAQTFERVPSTVDAKNNTVSATTPHFSVYIVFNGQRYGTQFTVDDGSDGSGDSGSGGSGESDRERRIIDGGFSDLDDWTALGDVSTDGTDAVVNSDAPTDDDGGNDDGNDGGDDDGSDGGDDGDDGDNDDPDLCYPWGCITPAGLNTFAQLSSGTTSTLERDVTFADDAVDATVRVTVEGDTTADRSSDASAVVETASGDRELFDLTSGTSGPVTREVDLSDVAGEEITIRFDAANGATLRVSDVTVSVTRDSDGDGLLNSEETDGFTLGTGETIYTSPYSADTDGDGLSDSRELGDAAENDYGTYRVLHSDPTEVDSDDDGVHDGAEQLVWKTDPLDADTDDDGYIDQVDKRPLVDSRVPNVLIYSGSPVDWTDGDFNENVTIRVSDHSEIDSLTIRAHYDPLYGDPFTVSQPPRLLSERIEGTQHVSTYNRSLDQHGWFDEPPEYYYVNATDAAGNRMSVKVDPNETVTVPEDQDIKAAVSSPRQILTGGSAGVVVSSEIQVGAGSGAVGMVYSNPYTAAGATVVAIGGTAVLGYTDYNQPAEGFEGDVLSVPVGGAVPATGTIETFHVDYAPFTIRWPHGAVYEAPGPGNERGFGWEYIRRTPGIHDQDDIEEVLRTPDSVTYRDGQVTDVIGETDDGVRIALRIGDGVIISAGELIRDPQGRGVEIDRSNRHPVGRDGHLSDYDQVERVIRNPAQIWEQGRNIHYIAYIDGEWVAVRVRFDGTKWTVSTSVRLGQTKESVQEYIQRWNLANRVYGSPTSELTHYA
ncbi:hypothetical protein [Halorarum salinum]|uniref:Uncharacterized protein n=1 Tax=Halorarum salinum TaxID=2743089 RepID=A0A7D5L835_9EURY|nr:hypothetical protein [Halobaculum salinum]QLG60268.1 hypothetical protein HUG12_00195 [Halobaculum salinum]